MLPRPVLVLAASLCLALSIAGPARAEDVVDPAKALVEELETLRKAEDVEALGAAIARTAEVYKATENASLRGKLRGELGDILKDDDLGDARLGAIKALTELEDAKHAWKEMSRELPDARVEEASPVDLAVVNAAGVLAQSRAIKPLLDLVAKSKDVNIAKAAAEALGGFREDKRGRITVVEELVSIGRRLRPGQSSEKGASADAIERWGTLGPAILSGLNRITGQKIISFDDWEALLKANKRRPQVLFVEREE